MSRQFIKELSEAYLIDNNIDNVDSTELCEQFLSELEDPVNYFYYYSLPILKQRQLFYEYFDLLFSEDKQQDNDTTTVIEEFAIGYILALKSALYLYVLFQILKATMPGISSSWEKLKSSILYNIGDIFHKIKKRGLIKRFRLAAIDSNLVTCYKKCGVDEKKIQDIIRLKTTLIGKFDPRVEYKYDLQKKYHCLTDCYINYYCDVCAEVFENYLACLRKSDPEQFQFLKTVPEHRLPETLIISKVLKGSCHAYHDELKNLLGEFDSLMKAFVDDDPEKEQKYRNLLAKKLAGKTRH